MPSEPQARRRWQSASAWWPKAGFLTVAAALWLGAAGVTLSYGRPSCSLAGCVTGQLWLMSLRTCVGAWICHQRLPRGPARGSEQQADLQASWLRPP